MSYSGASAMKSKSTQTQLKLPTSSPTPGGERWAPHDYQKTAVRWLVKHPEAALFLDPGLGKSSITLAAFKALRAAGGAKAMLVVAPLRPAALVWSQTGEVGKWSDFSDLRVSLIHGGAAAREAAIDAEADVYVINFEGLQWLCDGAKAPIRRLLERCDTIVFDELSKMKHASTKRFKAVKPWLGRFKRRWGLTGSPVANGLMDLFGQVFVLDLGQRLGRYITHYRFQYFLATGYGGYTFVPKDGADEAIREKLADLALSMRAEDHLDLPELVERNIWVDLHEKARKVYDAMQDEFLAMLDSGQVVAANAAVAGGKCRQIASGGLYIDDDGHRKVEHLHDAKTGALVDLVDELQGSPLLVGVEFHHDIQRIRMALGEDVPAIAGGTSPAESVELAAKWNRGEIPVLVGHPAAMAHGINLQNCGHHICWYSPTWNFELYDQFVRRVYRQGQKNRVIVHRILARNTVDATVAQVLAAKERTQDALLDALKKMPRRK